LADKPFAEILLDPPKYKRYPKTNFFNMSPLTGEAPSHVVVETWDATFIAEFRFNSTKVPLKWNNWKYM
jgi:hypothetical protein